MPKLLEWRGHRFHFYSHEPDEPPHVHVSKGRAEAKIWLETLEVARNRRYAEHELTRLITVVEENRSAFLEAWNEYFGD